MRSHPLRGLLVAFCLTTACAGSGSATTGPGAAPENTASPAGTTPSGNTAPPAATSTSPAATTGVSPVPTSTAQATSEPPHHIVGGFSGQDAQSPEVQAAAAKAISLLQAKTGDSTLALAQITSAETQVVAGMNYKMVLEVRSKSGPKTATVVVYRDLKGTYSLTSVSGL